MTTIIIFQLKAGDINICLSAIFRNCIWVFERRSNREYKADL